MVDPVIGDVLNRLHSITSESALGTNPKSNSGFKTVDFASVLQDGASASPAPPSPVDPKIEQLKSELRERLEQLPAAGSPNSPLDLIDEEERMRLLRQALASADSTGNIATTNFAQLEVDWREIEALITSGKSLSQHDLLILQARLYQVSEQIQLLSKIVDQLTNGIKTVMQTNV
jgi:hypothetical protein